MQVDHLDVVLNDGNDGHPGDHGGPDELKPQLKPLGGGLACVTGLEGQEE